MNKLVTYSIWVNLLFFLVAILGYFFHSTPILILAMPCFGIGMALALILAEKPGISIGTKALTLIAPFASPLLGLAFAHWLRASGFVD